MKRQSRPPGQSARVSLRAWSPSSAAVLRSGATAVEARTTVCPSLVVREAPAAIVANTLSAKPSATGASVDPLYFATAPYARAASRGRHPQESRAYCARSAAPPRMFCFAFALSSLAVVRLAPAAAATVGPDDVG